MKNNHSVIQRCISLVSLLAMLTSIASLTTTANAATALTRKTLVGTPIGGTNNIVAVDDDEMYAYVAQGTRLVALDIHTVPGTVTGYSYSQSVNGLILDIELRGNLAYLAAGAAGLVIMDISDPQAMHIVGSYLPENAPYLQANSIALVGNTVYLSTGAVIAIDVSNPASPVPLHMAGSAVNGLAVAGDRLYFMSNGIFLVSYDISTPGQFKDIVYKQLEQGQFYHFMSISGDRMLLGSSDGYVAYIDIANPAAPAILYTGLYADPTSHLRKIFLTSTTAYTAEGPSGVCVILIEDLIAGNHEKKRCQVLTDAFASSVVYKDDKLFAGFSDGLQVYTMEDFSPDAKFTFPITEIGSMVLAHGHRYVTDWNKLTIWDADMSKMLFSYPGTFRKIIPFENQGQRYLAVATNQSQLLIFNVENLESVPPATILSPYAPILDMDMVGSTVYLVTTQTTTQLTTVDLTSPAEPVVLGSVPLQGISSEVELKVVRYNLPESSAERRMAYIASWYNGLAVVDVSDPTNLGTPAHFNPETDYHNIAVLQDKQLGTPLALYISTWWQVEIYDPLAIGEGLKGTIYDGTQLGECRDMLIHDGMLFIGSNDVHVFDLSNPFSPTDLAYAKMPFIVTRLEPAAHKQILAVTGFAETFPITVHDRSLFLPQMNR